ncbi:MAG TPA: PQQ-binding-like beta-propeller repeat protein [Acidimicrobiales bacterium]|nr:PQQ-binding-like beta-propeller repeat protein [Acidimicrobiales bacterium]
MPTHRALAATPVATVLVVAASLLAGCSSTTPARAPSSTVAGPAPALPGGDWPTYQRDGARSGVDPAAPAFATPARRWSTSIDGDVYAQPLTVGDRVVVATEHDTVVAVQAGTGRVQWSTTLGQPVPGGDLPCGNIDPSGITGTPVIDAAAGTVWVVAFVQPGQHVLAALDLGTGAVRARTVIDPQGSDPRVEQQRGALTLSGGRVYVPFGGLYGDCGAYHGYLVGVDTRSPSSSPLVYQVPAQREAAVWAPGGAALAADGTLLIATGNGGATTYDGGNSVIRLSPDLHQLDSFTPTNAPQLAATDTDLGSTAPLQVGGGLVFQIGKEGVGYLLRADRLGGVGGQAYSAQVCGSVLGATTYASPLIIVPCEDGLVALRVSSGGQPGFTVAWRDSTLRAGPTIVADRTAWAMDRDAGDLVALDVTTGAVRARVHLGRSNHFASAASGGGQVYAAAGGQLVALAE